MKNVTIDININILCVYIYVCVYIYERERENNLFEVHNVIFNHIKSSFMLKILAFKKK